LDHNHEAASSNIWPLKITDIRAVRFFLAPSAYREWTRL